MTALGSMVRVHRWILDEKRQKLAEIERFADRIKLDLERLDENLAAERDAAAQSPDGSVAFASFIAAALERRRRLVDSITNLEREADLARDEVNEAFRELKKYEMAEDAAEKRESLKRKKQEQLALDEVGVGLYRRRSSGTDGTDA